MPAVPDFAIPEVTPDARLAPLNPDAGVAVGQAVAGLGKGIEAGAEQTTQTALSIQQLNDENAANDINNNAQKQLNNLLYGPDGFYTKSGKDAVAAYPQVQAAMQEIQNGAKSAAQNPYTQSVVGRTMDYMFNREQNQVGLHYTQETKTWQQNSLIATSDAQANTAALNWNNPDYATSAFHTNADVAQKLGAANGWSDAQTQDYQTTLNSKTAAGILDAAMAKDPAHAMSLYNQFNQAGYLNAQVSAEVGGRIRRAAMPGAMADISNGVISQFNAQNSTGGGQRPVNNPGNLRIPGSKDFQQFPTMAAGIDAMANQLLLDNKPTAQGGHGLTTIAAIIGDPVHGWAPASDGNNTGAYISAVAAAAGVDPNAPIDLDDKAVRAKVMSAMIKQEGDVPGKVPTPDDLMAAAPTLMQNASDKASAMFPDQPDAGQMAAQKVYGEIAKVKNAADMQRQGAMDTLTNFADANNVTDPSGFLQAGGDVAAAWAGLDPKDQAGIGAMLQKKLPGADDAWTPQKQAAYTTLTGMASTDPGSFAKLNIYDPNIVNALTSKQYGLLKDQWNAAQKGTGAGGPVPAEKLNGALAYVEPLLTTAGIPIKKTDPTYQQFAGAMGSDIQSYMQDHNGQFPSDADQQKIAQRLLVQGYHGTGNFLFGRGSEPLFKAENQFTLDPKTGQTLYSEGKSYMDPTFEAQVPDQAASAINAAFKAQSGRLPTSQELTAIYLQQMGPSAAGSK